MKYLYAFILMLFFFNQSSYSQSKTKKRITPSGKTIYINGFSDYKIEPFLTIIKKDSIRYHELRFNNTNSAMYAGKFMYDTFGEWDKFKLNKQPYPFVIWKNKKLFNDDPELYTVVTIGYEGNNSIYTSVLVFDSKNRDCLSDTSKSKTKLIQYFSEGIWNLTGRDKYYKLWHKEMKKTRNSKLKTN